MKRLLPLFLIFCLLFGCSGEKAPDPNDEVPGIQEPDLSHGDEPDEPEPDDDLGSDGDDYEITGNVNPLTGLCDGISDDALGKRPFAIMISNISQSLPQWGISQADIIYEMIAEGRITRFMAIYQDPSKMEKTGSIRSARPYYIDIAQSYGAVYMHFGGSVPAFNAIKARDDLVSVDGLSKWEGTLFTRDPERRKSFSFEHTVVTSGPQILEALPKLNLDYELSEPMSAFLFHQDHSAKAGEPMEKVTVTFGGSNKPYFEYDKETKTYFRYQHGGKQMDGLLNAPLEFKNVLVLRMKLTDVPNSDLKLVEVGTTGEGEGYYFCEGQFVEITWQKEKYNSEILFFTKDGEPLVCARGKSFISVTTTTADVMIE